MHNYCRLESTRSPMLPRQLTLLSDELLRLYDQLAAVSKQEGSTWSTHLHLVLAPQLIGLNLFEFNTRMLRFLGSLCSLPACFAALP